MTDKPILQSALECAARGWRVFPLHSIVDGRCTCPDPNCTSPGKHPYSQLVPRGLKDASSDPELIGKWFGNGRVLNLGVVTGEISGIDVLDIDGPEGEDFLRRGVETYGEELPITMQQKTGKGRHLIFQHESGTRNTAGRLSKCVDTRGDGGYIVFAPSSHISGVHYELIDGPIGLCPNWLKSRLKYCNKSTEQTPPARGNSEAIPEGQRDNQLTSLAGSMRRKGLDEEAIYAALSVHNEKHCQPPMSDADVRRIARSVSRYEPAASVDINTTDAGAGELFATYYGKQFRYCHSRGKWFVYDGKKWNTITGEPEARRAVVAMARRIRGEALKMPNNQRSLVENFARKLESSGKIDATLREARCVKPISCAIDDFDKDAWLLNTPTGTIDLRTGERRDNRPEDMITQITGTKFDPNADCPRFRQFLSEIMIGNEALIQYLIRWFGHCLTADIREQILLILYGEGLNGKSVLLDTLRGLMGDYATEAAPDLLIVKHGNEHPCEVADMFGKRLVVASESEKNVTLRLQLIKRITGDANLKARFMRQDYFSFGRTFKTILVTNNKPVIKEDTLAVWRRLKLVPFSANFSGAARDDSLRYKLQSEWPGILNLLLQGCKDWLKNGLCEPEEIEIATSEYRQSQDPLADFIAECCELNPGLITPVSILLEAFEEWEKKAGRDGEQIDSRAFNRSLRSRGCRYETQFFDGKTRKVWVGIDVFR